MLFKSGNSGSGGGVAPRMCRLLIACESFARMGNWNEGGSFVPHMIYGVMPEGRI